MFVSLHTVKLPDILLMSIVDSLIIFHCLTVSYISQQQKRDYNTKKIYKKTEKIFKNLLTNQIISIIIHNRGTDKSCQGVADIAQSVERILGKDEVPSSNLGISSSVKARKCYVYGLCYFLPAIFILRKPLQKPQRGIFFSRAGYSYSVFLLLISR